MLIIDNHDYELSYPSNRQLEFHRDITLRCSSQQTYSIEVLTVLEVAEDFAWLNFTFLVCFALGEMRTKQPPCCEKNNVQYDLAFHNSEAQVVQNCKMQNLDRNKIWNCFKTLIDNTYANRN